MPSAHRTFPIVLRRTKTSFSTGFTPYLVVLRHAKHLEANNVLHCVCARCLGFCMLVAWLGLVCVCEVAVWAGRLVCFCMLAAWLGLVYVKLLCGVAVL